MYRVTILTSEGLLRYEGKELKDTSFGTDSTMFTLFDAISIRVTEFQDGKEQRRLSRRKLKGVTFPKNIAIIEEVDDERNPTSQKV